MRILIALAPALLFMLTGCSAGVNSEDNETEIVMPPKAQFAAEKTARNDDGSISASGNQCIDQFNFLKKSGSTKYDALTLSYDQINEGYVFLNKNKSIMDKSSRRMYSQALKMQLDSLCESVKYSGYLLVRGKINALIKK